MADTMRAYRALLVLLAVGAVGATIFGGYGLYTVLTGGTTDGTVAIDALGEYDCEEFDGDPEVIHNASYGVDRTLLGGSVLESFNHSREGDRLRLVFDVDGGVLGTSASRPDGTGSTASRRTRLSPAPNSTSVPRADFLTGMARTVRFAPLPARGGWVYPRDNFTNRTSCINDPHT